MDNRTIKSRGYYNLNFVDWDNEGEAVIDHFSNLACNINIAQGVDYNDRPYFDVHLSEVEFLIRNLYDCRSTGLTDSEIARLKRIQNSARECTICLSSSTVGIKLPCGHVFHDSCIARWLRCRLDCPNCRRLTR